MFKSLFKRSEFFKEYKSDYSSASHYEVQQAAKEIVNAIGGAATIVCATIISVAVWIKS